MLRAPRVPCADPEARAAPIAVRRRYHRQSVQFSSRAELTVILRLTQYRFFCITAYAVAGARRAGVKCLCHTFSVKTKSSNRTYAGTRKHHHFRVSVTHSDGEKSVSGKVFNNRENADRYAAWQKKSLV